MGKIDIAVCKGILSGNPKLNDIIYPFLSDFDISWGAVLTAFNTKLDVFIIKPSKSFAETFGIDYELLLVYCPYPEMQARTMQAINSFFSAAPAKGRVESLICTVISDDPNVKNWIETYVTENQDLRTYVAFTKENILSPSLNVMSEFRKQLSARDLFDIQLPLFDDLYFFGRQVILQTMLDNVKRCENSGIFGLRKTGKTSLLYKLKRTVEAVDIGKVLIYDSKNVKIRLRTWTDLLLLIAEEISKEYGLPLKKLKDISPIAIAEYFEEILTQLPKQKKTVLIFDEIEYISFNPPLDPHWKSDYINFWQFLWSMQSSYRNICFVIAGVNPSVVEESSIETIQNPLFSIVSTYYLQGLERTDIYEMARRIGRRLGLKFDHTAIDYLYERYGGHPLLTRLALSYENRNAPEKPITFTQELLSSDEDLREEALIPYCQHIVDVLKDFYEEEYTLLEFLSIGATKDFIELALTPLSITHLKNYGLLKYQNKIPVIAIPVVESYIKRLYAKNEGTQLARPIVPSDNRLSWLQNNIQSIIAYMRQLEIAIRSSGSPMLFGSNSFPEADKLLYIPVAINENTFRSFITTLSNCFVESIQNYGKSIGNKNYFWNDIKNTYPQLFEALLRVKAYRNRSEHLELNPEMQKTVNRYLHKDLEGKNPCDVHEADFILQQCTVEDLRLAISLEISNFS